MGYYSDVAIAIDKPTYQRYALLRGVPRVLQDESPTEKDGVLYWLLTSQKWYDRFAEVQEVMEFLNRLDEEGDVTHVINPDRPPDAQAVRFTRAAYGYARVGEELGDYDTAGSPSEYDIFINQAVEVPF